MRDIQTTHYIIFCLLAHYSQNFAKGTPMKIDINEEMELPQLIYAKIYKIMPTAFRKAFSGFFFSISPDIPYDLSKRINEEKYFRPILYGVVLGIALYLITTAAFCYYEGVLYPSKNNSIEHLAGYSNIQYFYNDWVNLIMYLIVVPSTIGFGLALCLATMLTWRELDEFVETQRSSMIGWKGFIITVIILIVSSVAIASYINDVSNPEGAMQRHLIEKGKHVYFWYLGNPANNQTISAITVYYAIINYLNLVFILSCIAFFVTAIRPIVQLSKHLTNIKTGLEVDYSKRVLERLSRFGDVYFFAKILLFITMVHSIVWSYSPLSVGNNFNLERTFIVFTSIFFITIPRLHFETEWFKAAILNREKGIEIAARPSIIKGWKYHLVWILDFILIAGYLFSALGLFNFGHWGRPLF